MKRLLPFVFALAISSSATVSTIDAAGARENKRIQQGKITKNEAEHLVLKKYPGAKVTKCELAQGKDHGVWMLDVVKAGGSEVIKVQVDGRSGHILP